MPKCANDQNEGVDLHWVAFQIVLSKLAGVWVDSYFCLSLSNFSAPLQLPSPLLCNFPTQSKTKCCLLQHSWAASQSISMRFLALPKHLVRWPCHWLRDHAKKHHRRAILETWGLGDTPWPTKNKDNDIDKDKTIFKSSSKGPSKTCDPF